MKDIAATVRKLLGGSNPDFPMPPLEQGEMVVREGVAASTGGLFGRRWGPLILTNRRLIWYETATVIWPLKRIHGEVNLADVRSVDKGSLLDIVFGGRRLRFRLRTGKTQCLYVGDGKLNVWVSMIHERVGDDSRSRHPPVSMS